MTLTPKRRREYLEQPTHCPYCGSIDISPHTDLAPSADPTQARQWLRCDACGSTWADIYTLTDIEEGNDD